MKNGKGFGSIGFRFSKNDFETMKKLLLQGSGLEASALVLGCMRMAKLDAGEALSVFSAALECGVNFFDHADIYGGGESEKVFRRAMSDAGCPRDSIFIQSKCGIRSGYYDFSEKHILESVEGSLRRLGTEWLDVLLLHRPDALMEPEEVASAFEKLAAQGKVRHFGVSNHRPCQIELLRRAGRVPLSFNQIQFGLAHTPSIDAGVNANMYGDAATDRDGGVLDYCRLEGIQLQAWSPLSFGLLEGVFLESPRYAGLNGVLESIAAEKGAEPAAVALAWILRHPAAMQVVIGSMTPSRIRSMSRAGELEIGRQEWYALYRAAGNRLP